MGYLSENMMQKQNDSRCSSKYVSPRNPSTSHPSLPFADISGPFPFNLSSDGRNSISLRKGQSNLKPVIKKLSQVDAMCDVFPPFVIAELQTQTNFLIEGLGSILKLLEPDFKPKVGNIRSHRNESDEISSAGDVDRHGVEGPALWTQPSPMQGNLSTPEAELTVTSKPENKSDVLKGKLLQLLDCAFKIKNAIPTKLQYPHSESADTLHMPTGAIVTPGTQTEPIDTYVKFLQVIDEAAGFSSETTEDSRNRTPNRRTNPGSVRMRINKNRTMDTAGRQHKLRSPKPDRRSSDHSLDNVLNETLNRKNVPNLYQKRKPLNVDVTVAEVMMSNPTVEDGIDKGLPKTSEKSQPYVSSLSKRSKKSAKMPPVDTSTFTKADDKRFSLTEYISALKQVSIRSPSTKRIREFSMRPKTYFDFDDYYEKLINMHDNYKMNTDPVHSNYLNTPHLKQL